MATLGPSGTDAENAAMKIISEKAINGEINLCSTFFGALNSVVEGKNDIAIVPSAFPQFANCVFDFPELEITESFVLPLKKLVMAKRKNVREIKNIAIHPATRALVKENIKIIEVKSKPLAAKLVSLGKADACIASLDVVNALNLEVVKEFSQTNMSWNIFRRKK